MMSNSLKPDWLTKPANCNLFDQKIWPKSMLRDFEGHTSIGGVAVGAVVRSGVATGVQPS
jgi:hypothetical protein